MSGGSKSSNDQIIQQQQAEAIKAEQNERERQNRLRAGRNRIKAMFSEEGGTYVTPGKYVNKPIYSMVTTPSHVNTTDRRIKRQRGGQNEGVYWETNPHYGQTPGTHRVQTGTEKVFRKGKTREQEGIGTGFYDKFRQAIMDYYTPEIERQHSEAKDANLYDLARRGLLRSSVASKNAEELVRERAEADANLTADAENQTAGLRGDIANAQQTALSLLQQTEDPAAAANAAATEVNAIQSRSPNFSPLGDLFSAAARSFAGWQNAQNMKRAYGSIPVRNPYTSSGKTVN